MVRSPRAEAIGEQGEHYDPLFTYKEGEEAGYFAVLEEFERRIQILEDSKCCQNF